MEKITLRLFRYKSQFILKNESNIRIQDWQPQKGFLIIFKTKLKEEDSEMTAVFFNISDAHIKKTH